MTPQMTEQKQDDTFSLTGTAFYGVQPLDTLPTEVRMTGDAASAASLTPTVPDRDHLIVEHLPTVRYIARKIHERMPQHVDLEDLISAGHMGLMDAAAKFDQAKEVQFKSYAQFRIRGAILDSLRTLDWSPRELRRQGRAMAEAIRSLATRLGRTPNDAEIAAEMHMDLKSFQQMTGDLKGLELGSLNQERTEEAGDEELNFVAAPAQENPLTVCMQSETREQLSAAIATLPERERLVLTLYHFEELTLKEIALTLGVVESRVSQIRASAVAHLRKKMTPRPTATSRHHLAH